MKVRIKVRIRWVVGVEEVHHSHHTTNIHLPTFTVDVGVWPARTLGLDREADIRPPVGAQQKVLDLGMALGSRGLVGG